MRNLYTTKSSNHTGSEVSPSPFLIPYTNFLPAFLNILKFIKVHFFIFYKIQFKILKMHENQEQVDMANFQENLVAAHRNFAEVVEANIVSLAQEVQK